MKLIDILKTANGNLGQSKLRTFLTVIAVFIGAFTITLTTGVGAGISKYIDEQIGGLGAPDLLVVQAKSDTGSPISTDEPKEYDPGKATVNTGFGAAIPALTTADLDKIRAVDGIKEVTAVRNVIVAYVSGPSGKKYDMVVQPYISGTNLTMTTGEKPDNASGTATIALPYNYVKSLGFADDADTVGKTVTIGVLSPSGEVKEVTATISGVPLKSLVSQGGANINEALVSKIDDIQNEGVPAASREKYFRAYAKFDLSVGDQGTTDLKKRLADMGYQAQTIADTLGVIQKVINGIIMVFNLFAAIALIAASFGVINTLLMAVQERTREIGLMKAMGMGSRKIFLLFSVEAILLGFWGSLLGVLAAMGVGQIINKVATQGFLKDFTGLSLLAFPVQSVLGIMLIIMAIAFLAGTLPARRAAKLNPIEALRYE